MYFAKPYIANKQIVIVPEGSEIKTVADLKENGWPCKGLFRAGCAQRKPGV